MWIFYFKNPARYVAEDVPLATIYEMIAISCNYLYVIKEYFVSPLSDVFPFF